MNRPLLDTHIWLWWMFRSGDLAPTVLERLDRMAAGDRPLLSAISLWETAMLVERGRVTLDRDLGSWLRAAAAPECVDLVPITPDVAAESALLPATLHRDPADRLLIATARVMSCPVLTRDERILKSGLVKLWTS